jgi:phosphinothricin acetyltransferase
VTPTVRDATSLDGERCAAIYAPYVTGTVASFETEAPDAAEMTRRISSAQRAHAWLVAEVGGQVVGYAYGGPYRARPAYRWTTEVSVYVAADGRRRGTGRALYDALLERLGRRGYRTVVAGMTLPNPASAALHAAMGFEQAGVLRDVGWKLGAWHDVALLRRSLGEHPTDDGPPADPR